MRRCFNAKPTFQNKFYYGLVSVEFDQERLNYCNDDTRNALPDLPWKMILIIYILASCGKRKASAVILTEDHAVKIVHFLLR